MSRYLNVLAWSVVGLFATLAVCIAILAQYDWNRTKPWLNARVSEATGRPFAIQGNLSIDWDKPVAEQIGWHRWIPWPHVNARDIVFGNPNWVQSSPYMAQVGQVTFSLSPIALLGKKILVRNLQLDEPLLFLARAKNGDNNWTFKPSATSAWQFEISQLSFAKGKIHLVDAIKRADMVINVDTLDNGATAGHALQWKLAGTLDKEAVSGSGKAGAILSLQQQEVSYPVQAHFTIGKTTIAVDGTLTNPRTLAALNVRLKLAGTSMAKLYGITGIPFPETPAFSTEGQLTANFAGKESTWQYDKFKGRVGSSDLSGTFNYQSGQPRPHLKATLVSNVLLLKDLAPLIGADSKASKVKRSAATKQPVGKVLPVEPFKTERWTSIDADVKFTGRRIIRDKQLPIQNLVTELHLQDGVLSLQPLNFGIAGGNLISTIVLDGRGKLIKAKMKISARHLQLQQVLPTFQSMQTSLGEVNGDASLSATGNSIAAMLASSNGEIKAFIDGGTISKLLLEKIGLNIDQIILTQLTGDKQVKLNCMASDFAVTNGVMHARTFLIDTEDAILDVTGHIDLAQEQLALTIKPDTKTLRLTSLRAPFYITGSFNSPQVKVDKGVLALKAGAVVALAIVAPVLTAVLPLVNLGPGKDSDCDQLLSDVRKKPVAPAPGKTYRVKPASTSLVG